MRTTHKVQASVLLSALLLAGCGTAPPKSAGGTTHPAPPISGPKQTIAVGKIEATPGLAGPFGSMMAGPAVASMLTTALSESGRFIVTERDDLTHVLTEQDLTMAGRTQGTAAPTPGAIIPAQYLVVGAVTELSTGDNGMGTGVGNGTSISLGFPLRNGLLPALSLNGQKGKVALDLRLVNTRTGQVEDTFTVRKELSSIGVGLTLGYGAMSLGGNQAWSAPLGETMRAALDEAVSRIAADASRGEWDGQIAEVAGDTVIINSGGEAGLHTGDRLTIERQVGALTDPATNQVLAVRNAQLGTVEITRVDPKFAVGTLAGTSGTTPRRGDAVVLARQ